MVEITVIKCYKSSFIKFIMIFVLAFTIGTAITFEILYFVNGPLSFTDIVQVAG